MKKPLICTILIAGLIASLSAQDINQREYSLLEKNIDLYQTGKYEKAEQNFALIISRLPNSIYITTNYLMWAKSKYKLKDFKGAIKITRSFMDLFPTSTYRDDILQVQGNCYFQITRYETAIDSWLQAIEVSTNDVLIQKLGYQITKTLRYKFDQSGIDHLLAGLESVNGRMLVQIALAEEELENGRKDRANQIIQSALSDFPGTRFVKRATSLVTEGEIRQTEVAFALLLPLSGANEKIGNEIKEGFEFAFNEYNVQKGTNLKLIVEDYGEELITAIRAYQRLAKNNNVVAVLGPLENDISAACAALSDYEGLPIVSPTATETELTRLTDRFFQVNSSVGFRAACLAKYAIDTLKLHRFATFAPLDNHFIKMVAAFVENVQSSGGEIISQEWYYPGDQDVNKQFMNLKRIGLRLTFADSVSKIQPGLKKEQIDSLYNAYEQAQYELINENNTKIDSADIAVKSIDGIFIPIFKEDLKFIAPQVAYSNIQAQYLGNGDWYDPDELKKNKNYINGLIFISDGYLNEESWDYKKFKNDYRQEIKKTPTIYNVVGYDCCRYMLGALKDPKNPITRSEYFQNLRSREEYNGLYRKIKMNEDQSNVSLRLLKYIYGQIIPLN